EVCHRTYRKPGLAQRLQSDLRLDTLPDVARRLSAPDDVGDVSGGVIEGGHAKTRIVRGGDKGVTGAQACAHDAELAVTLLLEPIKTAADVDHALPDGIERAADVGGDGIVGATDFGGHADIVIRHAQAQYGDAQHIQHAAEAGVGDRVGVPVRQENDGAAAARGKPACVGQVIFGI